MVLIIEITMLTISSVCTLTAAWKQYKSIRVNDIRSNATAKWSEPSPSASAVLRGTFQQVAVPKCKSVYGHTHGVAAADRSTGTRFAETFAAQAGLTPYFVQCSAADERKGRARSRNWHWVKDGQVKPVNYSPPQDALMVYVDSDEYEENMPTVLADEFKATLLYTFQPSQVAKSDGGDYQFTFDQKGQVVYTVNGGGQYVHKVWNYTHDNLVVRKRFLGIPYYTATFLVERRNTDVDHQLVLITPLQRWGFLGSLLAWNLQGGSLTRMNPVVGDFLRLKVQSKNELCYSTGKVGSYNQATVPVTVDDALGALARTSTTFTPHQVKTYIKSCDDVAAVSLYEFHCKKLKAAADLVSLPGEGVNHYTNSPERCDPHTKPVVTAFMKPLIDECYAPTRCKENDECMVEERITKVAVPPTEPDAFVQQCMIEFTDMFIPKDMRHMIHPVDAEEVYKRQNRPTQNRILREAASNGRFIKRIIKSFQKGETYNGVKAPRPISTINGNDKFDYSRFTYALAEHLKTMPWYAFGKTPVEIAQRVADVLAQAKQAINTDLSKCDGRVSSTARLLERMIAMAAFPLEYHEELDKLMKSQYNQKGVTSFGVIYDTLTSRLSGSPETALFNSILNAFIAFLALRRMGLTPKEAWKRLGVYGGDDGMTADVIRQTYEQAARDVGQVLTADEVKRGDLGIKFLARCYSRHVWEGDVNSMCDVRRQLSKYHVTTAVDASAVDKLWEKSYAYYLCDKNTPIIGPFASAVAKLRGFESYSNLTQKWNGDLAPELQYPNDYGDWMQDVVTSSGLGGFRQSDLLNWINTRRGLGDFLEVPMFIDPFPIKVDKPVLINGDIVLPDGMINIAWHSDPSETRMPKFHFDPVSEVKVPVAPRNAKERRTERRAMHPKKLLPVDERNGVGGMLATTSTTVEGPRRGPIVNRQ